MLVNKWNRLLFSATGEADAGGGTSTGSLLNPSTGGGKPSATAGNGNPASGAAQNQTPTGNPAAGASAQGTDLSDWKSSLPPELREEASLNLFKDVSGLAKSYLNAQKLISADKIPVPGKHATDEDWKGVFSKLGLPQDLKDYEVKFQEGVTLDKEFSEAFKQQAHAAGILPKQAQALADWFGKTNLESEQKMQKDIQAQQTKQLEGLKSEWGAAFDQNLNKAQQVVAELGNPELVEFLDKSGLGNDVRMVKLFSEIGKKFLSEGKEVGSKNSMDPVMTPADARKEHAAIMGNMKHPYWDNTHPGHKAAVDEVANLFKLMNPSKSTVDKI